MKTYTVYGQKIRVDLERMVVKLIQRQPFEALTPDEMILYYYLQRGGKIQKEMIN